MAGKSRTNKPVGITWLTRRSSVHEREEDDGTCPRKLPVLGPGVLKYTHDSTYRSGMSDGEATPRQARPSDAGRRIPRDSGSAIGHRAPKLSGSAADGRRNDV